MEQQYRKLMISFICLAILFVTFVVIFWPKPVTSQTTNFYTVTLENGEVFNICADSIIYSPDNEQTYFVNNVKRHFLGTTYNIAGMLSNVVSFTSEKTNGCPVITP